MDESIKMDINEITDNDTIDFRLTACELFQLSKEQSESSFKITKTTIQSIIQIMNIISQRNIFRINEYKTIGEFYQMLQEIKDDTIEGKSIQILFNILQTCSNRGGFHLHEFEMISNLYNTIKSAIAI